MSIDNTLNVYLVGKDNEILDKFTYKIEAIAPDTSFYYGDTFEYESKGIQKVRYEIRNEKNAGASAL